MFRSICPIKRGSSNRSLVTRHAIDRRAQPRRASRQAEADSPELRDVALPLGTQLVPAAHRKLDKPTVPRAGLPRQARHRSLLACPGERYAGLAPWAGFASGILYGELGCGRGELGMRVERKASSLG